MNTNNINQEIIEIITTVIGEPVPSNVERGVLSKWDSLRHMQIIFSVEERFGVQFSESEIAQVKSVDDIAAKVERTK